MSTQTRDILKLAKEIINKEAEKGVNTDHSPELLQALSTVAAALKLNASYDSSIMKLVGQVEQLIEEKNITPK